LLVGACTRSVSADDAVMLRLLAITTLQPIGRNFKGCEMHLKGWETIEVAYTCRYTCIIGY